jgi:hypothetical protein
MSAVERFLVCARAQVGPVMEIPCQNCGTHFNVHRECDIVKCPNCRVRMHAHDLSPWGCHEGDKE